MRKTNEDDEAKKIENEACKELKRFIAEKKAECLLHSFMYKINRDERVRMLACQGKFDIAMEKLKYDLGVHTDKYSNIEVQAICSFLEQGEAIINDIMKK